jgi:TolB protein
MKSLWFLLIGVQCLFGASQDEKSIVVRLESGVQLLPLYLAPLIDENGGFSKSYLKQMESVLRFDLGYNGMTYLLQSHPEWDKRDQKTGWGFQGPLSCWEDQGVSFVIKTRVKDKKLSARLYIINSQTMKSIDDLSLTGDLNVDRKTIHRLADTFYETLFNAEGIAATQIIYTLKKQDAVTKKWTSEVLQADYDGGNIRQITQDGGYCVTPSWIAPKPGKKGGNFVVVSYKIGQPKIYLSDVETGALQRFSPLKGNQLMPTISYQRDKMAFISDVTGNPDLFLQDFDPEKGAIGKPRQIFTAPKATQGTPAFSPDGKKIAFVSNKDGSARIYVMDTPAVGALLKNTKTTLISKINRENTAPSWSPDGKKLAYCSLTKGVRQIWVYDWITRTEKQITEGAGSKENPSWAPNSLHIVFNLTDNSGSELYLVNLNQKETIKISSGMGEKRFPSWEIR